MDGWEEGGGRERRERDALAHQPPSTLHPPLFFRHLPKLFDNVHALHWRPLPDGNPSTAVAMVSGEGEVVPFAAPCECSGPVEVWLARLVSATRAAVAAAFEVAVPAYEDAPSRVGWALATPAQMAASASRAH